MGHPIITHLSGKPHSQDVRCLLSFDSSVVKQLSPTAVISNLNARWEYDPEIALGVGLWYNLMFSDLAPADTGFKITFYYLLLVRQRVAVN